VTAADRTPRADARANRERIIEAARHLYAEEGLDVSFNAVAHRAGIGNATLYRHFGSHQELRDAVYLTRIEESSDLLVRLAATDEPATELRRYLHWVFETADRSLIALAVARETRSPEVRAAGVRLRQLISDLVERAHAVGALRHDVEAADVMVAAVALVDIARFGEISRERARGFRDVVLRGLGLD
jgi:AcrR family transcriptional regulator